MADYNWSHPAAVLEDQQQPLATVGHRSGGDGMPLRDELRLVMGPSRMVNP